MQFSRITHQSMPKAILSILLSGILALSMMAGLSAPVQAASPVIKVDDYTITVDGKVILDVRGANKEIYNGSYSSASYSRTQVARANDNGNTSKIIEVRAGSFDGGFQSVGNALCVTVTNCYFYHDESRPVGGTYNVYTYRNKTTDIIIRTTGEPFACEYEGEYVLDGYYQFRFKDSSSMTVLSYSALKALKQTAWDMNPYKYTTSSWDAMWEVYKEASDAIFYGTNITTQAQLNAIETKFRNAINALVLRSDISVLETLVYTTYGLNEAHYTAESWSALQQVVAEANALRRDRDSTQAAVNAGVTKLQNAIDALVAIAVDLDTAALEALITSVDTLNALSYTEQSWATLQGILADAEALMANSDKTQAQVDDMATQMQNAIDGLVLKSNVNTGTLEALVTSANSLIPSDYTPESWAALQTTLASVNTLLNNPNKTQAMVNAMTTRLQGAVNGLVAQNGSVNCTALNALVSQAQGLNQNAYTSASWSNLQTVLGQAQDLVAADDKTQPQVDAKVTELQGAIDGLVSISNVNTGALEALVTSANALNPTDYTPESWATLQTTLTSVRTLLNNPNKTQALVNVMTTRLQSAVDGLVARDELVNCTALNALISQGEGLNQNAYTSASWSNLQTVLGQARDLVAASDKTQAQIDAKVTELQGAIDSLALKPTVDTTALEALITTANALTESDYTPASWTAMKTVLNNSNTLMANPNKTQSLVNITVTRLRTAIEGLVTA